MLVTSLVQPSRLVWRLIYSITYEFLPVALMSRAQQSHLRFQAAVETTYYPAVTGLAQALNT